MKSENTKIRILLVDDHSIVRAGYRMLLRGNDDIEIVGEADSGEMACRFYDGLKPDMVIMDLSLPGMSGLEAVRRLVSRDSDVKIMVFSMHSESVFVEQALNAGARGYITKSSAPGILVQAIREIASGNTFISNDIAQQLVFQKIRGKDSALTCLSAREFDIFCLLAEGLSSGEIAVRLSLSPKTIANYSTQIKSKLNITSLADITKLAIRYNVISS
jgi:two-component system invasion response regulator UvrY